MRVAGGDLYGVVVKAPTEPAGENAGGDLWGVATKAPTEPAGENVTPKSAFLLPAFSFFRQKENASARTL